MKKYRMKNGLPWCENWAVLNSLVFRCFDKLAHNKTGYMEKYQLKSPEFLAQQYTGDVDPMVAACEAVSAGSADSFTWKDHDKSLSFTDANGSEAVALPNDWLQAENTAPTDGSAPAFKGWLVVSAANAANFVLVAG